MYWTQAVVKFQRENPNSVGQLLDTDDWHRMYKELIVQAAQRPDDEESCVSVNAGAEDGTAGPNQSSVASANEAAEE
ncbi:hypothetical protein HAZT_HAZT010037 [Hyalella azteca]|uniref:Uncharacterized protein n=1 Tax=Hyalella azteca TaxID=294128 RepID=A0A6A0GW22_HYAAZ|nr:hypothetical protein HAZT_HAZT010037 [Hyalella azteca]